MKTFSFVTLVVVGVCVCQSLFRVLVIMHIVDVARVSM